MANFLKYGLTPGRGRDIGRAMNTALRLKTGYVWIDSVNAHLRAMIEERYFCSEESFAHVIL